jgi:hypothetical protein
MDYLIGIYAYAVSQIQSRVHDGDICIYRVSSLKLSSTSRTTTKNTLA